MAERPVLPYVWTVHTPLEELHAAAPYSTDSQAACAYAGGLWLHGQSSVALRLLGLSFTFVVMRASNS